MRDQIPIHDFSEDDSTSIAFELQLLEKREDYDTSVPHRHNYYEIFLFIKGGGAHDIDFETIPIESNSLHFVSPGQVHQVKRELDSYGYVIFFSRDFYALNLRNKDILFDLPFLNNNSIHPFLNLNDQKFKPFLELTSNVEGEINSTNPLKEEILRSYLNILLIQCKRIYEELHIEDSEQDVSINQTFQDFRIQLEKNFTKLHKVSDYAQLLSVSEKSLNEIMKKTIGKTASELIHERIILEAKRLVLYSDYNNKEIAYFLEFDDPSHFSKFFKNYTGSSPNDYREKRR